MSNEILKQSGGYSLSQTGKIVALNIIKLIEACTSLEELEKMFLHHEISPIPEYLLESIGSLKHSFVVESTPTDVMKPHTLHAELIQNSTDVKYISSVLLPQKIESFEETLEKGSLRLILTSEILDKWIEIIGRENLKKALLEKDFKLREINESIKISFTVSDNFFALGLFQTDGIYDLHKYLIGRDQDAIQWGNRLFDYYLKRSKNVKL